jgi:hypothetical protein
MDLPTLCSALPHGGENHEAALLSLSLLAEGTTQALAQATPQEGQPVEGSRIKWKR